MTSIFRHIHQSALGLLPGDTAVMAMKMWCRKALTRTLLIAYALFLLKPVMPILMDKMAHAFWMNLHVAVVHKVNGKEHVHYEIRKMAEHEKDNSGLVYKISVEELYVVPVMILPVAEPASYPLHIARPMVRYLRAHEDAESNIVTPPPKSV